jgi:glutathione S-transferase
LGQRLAYVANHMASRQYLVGEHFTVADAYLYTVLTWTRLTGIDLAAWPVLAAYRERIQQRPAVQAARKAVRARQLQPTAAISRYHLWLLRHLKLASSFRNPHD